MGNCHKEEERGGDAKVEPPRGRIWRTRQEGAAKDHNERAGGESVPIGRMKRGAHTGAWRDRRLTEMTLERHTEWQNVRRAKGTPREAGGRKGWELGGERHDGQAMAHRDAPRRAH